MSDTSWYRRRWVAFDRAYAAVFGGPCGGPWYRRHRAEFDVATALFFVLLDTGLTLVGSSWWPAHPGPLA